MNLKRRIRNISTSMILFFLLLGIFDHAKNISVLFVRDLRQEQQQQQQQQKARLIMTTEEKDNDDNNNRRRRSSRSNNNSNSNKIRQIQELVGVEQQPSATAGGMNNIIYDNEICTPIGRCELCTDSDKVLIRECGQTGRFEILECVIKNTDDNEESDEEGDEDDNDNNERADNNNSKIKNSRIVYQSCNFTESDEEFRFMRFQILTLMIGIGGMYVTRRQKIINASLFDQRKRSSANNANNKNPVTSIIPSGMVEMISTTKITTTNTNTTTPRHSNNSTINNSNQEETKGLIGSSTDNASSDVLDVV